LIFDRHVIENNFGFWNDSDGSDQSGLHLLLTAVVYEALAKAERDKRTNARASHHEPKRGPFRPPPVPPPACSGFLMVFLRFSYGFLRFETSRKPEENRKKTKRKPKENQKKTEENRRKPEDKKTTAPPV
jgi:hypothetical protein